MAGGGLAELEATVKAKPYLLALPAGALYLGYRAKKKSSGTSSSGTSISPTSSTSGQPYDSSATDLYNGFEPLVSGLQDSLSQLDTETTALGGAAATFQSTADALSGLVNPSPGDAVAASAPAVISAGDAQRKAAKKKPARKGTPNAHPGSGGHAPRKPPKGRTSGPGAHTAKRPVRRAPGQSIEPVKGEPHPVGGSHHKNPTPHANHVPAPKKASPIAHRAAPPHKPTGPAPAPPAHATAPARPVEHKPKPKPKKKR